MSNLIRQDVERAAAHLDKTDKGRQAARDLLALLEHGGLSLDVDNQLAVLVLLRGAWGEYAGTVRSLLREQAEAD